MTNRLIKYGILLIIMLLISFNSFIIIKSNCSTDILVIIYVLIYFISFIFLIGYLKTKYFRIIFSLCLFLFFPILTSINDSHEGSDSFIEIPGECCNSSYHSYLKIEPFFKSFFQLFNKNKINIFNFTNIDFSLLYRIKASNMYYIHFISLVMSIIFITLYLKKSHNKQNSNCVLERNKKNSEFTNNPYFILKKILLPLICGCVLLIFIYPKLELVLTSHTKIFYYNLIFLMSFLLVFFLCIFYKRKIYISLLFTVLLFPNIGVSFSYQSILPENKSNTLNYRYVTIQPLPVSIFHEVQMALSHNDCEPKLGIKSEYSDYDTIRQSSNNARILSLFYAFAILFSLVKLYKNKIYNQFI